jgi:putative ABC transport system substrate-binding protein
MRLRLADALILAALLTAGWWSADSWAQAKLPRVGILGFSRALAENQWYEGFYRTLRDQGWIEGETVALVHATASSDTSRFPEAAAELVRLKVDVIFADSAPAVRAAYAATRSIPIVGIDFTTDPVAAGYARSYSRPGGNVTGVFLDAPEFSAKWLEVLKGVLPGLSRVAALWDPSPGVAHRQALEGTAQSFKLQLQVIEVHKPKDIDEAGSAFRGRPQALIILPSPMMYAESARLAKLAAAQRLPATSFTPAFASAGGLMGYGPDLSVTYERSAALVARILGGAKPGDLPVERPTKIKLVVNLNAAKALNLKIPDSVVARADEVIR